MLSRRLLIAAILLLPAVGTAAPLSTGGAHAFSFRSIDGEAMPLSAYRGRPMLIVNTATECGFAPQFRDLQALWEQYRERGLVVVGVPSNDFGGQEPGSADDIKGVCSGTYGVTFPLTEKTAVRGPDAHPFYAWAALAAGREKAPAWNFHKYLLAPDGRIAATFPTATNPRDPRVVAAIEALLAPPAN